MPKQIDVHGYVFKDMAKVYVIDSIAGGVRFDYHHHDSSAVLGIMRDHASYCITSPYGNGILGDSHGRKTQVVFSRDHATIEDWNINLAISMIQHDKKLKQALDEYMDQPHVKREIARHAYR